MTRLAGGLDVVDWDAPDTGNACAETASAAAMKATTANTAMPRINQAAMGNTGTGQVYLGSSGV